MAALWLWAQPDPRALLPLYEENLARREKEAGDAHIETAQASRDLGLYLRGLGELERAREYLARALAIRERVLGPEHDAVLSDAEELGLILPPERAAPLFERAARSRDPEMAARNLARLGRYREALARQEQASGPNGPKVAVRLNDLALSLEPPQAAPLLRRALAIQEKSLGPKHPETATTLNNLANVLLATGKPAEAAVLQRRALASLETALGPRHPRVATACSNLADIVRTQGAAAEALRLYRRALAIDEQAYGPAHPEVALDLRNLAGMLDELGRKAEAAKLLARAQAIPQDR